MHFDLIIRSAQLAEGTGAPLVRGDLAVTAGAIAAMGDLSSASANEVVDATNLVLAPGFIDVHTHDDLQVIKAPEMLAKISQGITTVVVGNCGISASPVVLRNKILPDPMNLLGAPEEFAYPNFAAYVAAVDAAQPRVNVAALVGHTSLRNNQLDHLQRRATASEIAAMQRQLREALAAGALGLSSGLAYASASASDTQEVAQLAQVLNEFGGVYTTHLRTEFDGILQALDEAYAIGKGASAPIIVSHLKCAGAGNWGRAGEVLKSLDLAGQDHPIGCDCYPYAASSSTLDLAQVTEDFAIGITWSQPHPEMSGKTLAEIAAEWHCSLLDAAKKLQPAGAVYHGMSEADVQQILANPRTMIGSDGLPVDPLPHPRLWGAFPRVLGHYARDLQLFSLSEAIRKMTGLSAARFGLSDRGLLQVGRAADLVLFDPARIKDTASFTQPQQLAEGIAAVWVNGQLSYAQGQLQGGRAGKFLARSGDLRETFV